LGEVGSISFRIDIVEGSPAANRGELTLLKVPALLSGSYQLLREAKDVSASPVIIDPVTAVRRGIGIG